MCAEEEDFRVGLSVSDFVATTGGADDVADAEALHALIEVGLGCGGADADRPLGVMKAANQLHSTGHGKECAVEQFAKASLFFIRNLGDQGFSGFGESAILPEITDDRRIGSPEVPGEAFEVHIHAMRCAGFPPRLKVGVVGVHERSVEVEECGR